jgi:hypothetical protein
MTKQKTGFGSRRGFLARLAAMGTVLGGVVPELRAYGMTGSTPWTSPNMGSTPGMGGSTAMPTNPSMAPTTAPPQSSLSALTPSASALLFSSALTDPDVEALLAHVERGATIMPVKSSADLGSDGQIIKLPIRGSSGVTTAFILYGRVNVTINNGRPSPLSIRVLLKSDSTTMLSHAGKVGPASPDAASVVRLLNSWAFPEEYRARLREEIAAGASPIQTAPAGVELPLEPWMLPVPRSKCYLDWRTCCRNADLPDTLGANGAWVCGLIAALAVLCLFYPPALALTTLTPTQLRFAAIGSCAFSLANVMAGTYHKETCDYLLERCLQRATV